MIRFAPVGLAVLALALCSCETVIVRDGLRISGRTDQVSTADIRAAIDADVQAHHGDRTGTPSQVEVAGPNEVHLYWYGLKWQYAGHHIVRRERGKWQCVGRVIVTS